MRAIKPFFLKLMIVFFLPQVSQAVTPFASEKQLMKKLHEVGFEYVIKTPYSKDLRVKFIGADGSFLKPPETLENGDPVVKIVEELSYRYKSGDLAVAHQIGSSLVCFTKRRLSFLSGKATHSLKNCVIFPYDVSDVVEALAEKRSDGPQ